MGIVHGTFKTCIWLRNNCHGFVFETVKLMTWISVVVDVFVWPISPDLLKDDVFTRSTECGSKSNFVFKLFTGQWPKKRRQLQWPYGS